MSHLTAQPWRLPRPRRPRSHLTTSPWPVPSPPDVQLAPVVVAGALVATATLPGLSAAAGTQASVALGPTVATAADDALHTVRRGETLSGIAVRNGTTVRALMDANGLTDPNRILAGQQLLLEPAASAPAAPAAPSPAATHTVRPGETLSGIAARHGTSWRALAELNDLPNPSRILVGQVLRLADVEAAAPSAAPEAEREPAPAAPPAQPASAERFHTVSRGESLSLIAARYGVSVQALAAENGITNVNLVRVGQGLRVPGQAPATVACPVPGASFVDDYGYVKPSGRVHEGVDLFAPRGTPVLAPVAGTAQQVTGPRAGLQVTFHGDDGATYYLTHLDAFGAAGRVAAGTQIGTVGNTGNAANTSPHVHFERHEGGQVTNPHPWLVARC